MILLNEGFGGKGCWVFAQNVNLVQNAPNCNVVLLRCVKQHPESFSLKFASFFGILCMHCLKYLVCLPGG